MKAITGNSCLPPYCGHLFLAFLLISVCIPFPVGSEELGRLFFTPERRQMLDRQRQLNIQERKEVPEDPTLTINGVVTRSSGKRTIWVNGAMLGENDVGSVVAVIPSRSDPGKVIVQADGAPSTKASIGDTVSRNTGETADLLGGGQLTVKRRQ